VSEPADLLELQATDIEIARAAKRLDELPEKAAILQARAKQREVAGLAEKAQLLLHKLEAEVRHRKDEAEMIDVKLEQEQAKIMATTDHRAVQSISREMDGLKRRRDKIEMEELQFMERVEKARSQVEAIAEHQDKLVAKEAELVEEFKTQGGGIQRKMSTLETRRASLAASIAPLLLESYEAARAAKGGIGVGQLEGTRCSACRMELPAERVKALSEGPDVGVCPQCRRLIVVRGTE